VLSRRSNRVVGEFPCENRKQLHSRERHFIETLPNVVNKYIPTRTRQEYHQTEVYKKIHSDSNKKYGKVWRTSQDFKIHCECGKITDKSHVARHVKSARHLKYEQALEKEFQELCNKYNHSL
jgi:hypothetical protein